MARSVPVGGGWRAAVAAASFPGLVRVGHGVGVAGMRVFVSHASEDKARVRELADALRSRGFDPWLDEWEIHGGDDFVRRINEGIHACPVAVIVFSASAWRSPWVDAETSYLAYARIKEGKVVVPLVLGDVASESIPALLRPVHRHRIDRIDDIAAALRAQPQPASTRALDGPGDRVVITLKRVAPRGVDVRVTISGLEYGKASLTELPRELQVARDAFLRGALQGTMRAPSAHQRAQAESLLAQLGRQLRDVCLPSDAQSALAALVQPRVGNAVDVVFEADDPELLGLPFEALRLADDSLLATAASVVVWRRPLGLAATSLRAP
ncbi:MAG: toll/interleukin-1 receptor domain-containing protein, partial [Planctomycetes bacterium]|nr:toll/interleukin-1 receptor domain-containing protein [Planctomycetota bacterium]